MLSEFYVSVVHNLSDQLIVTHIDKNGYDASEFIKGQIAGIRSVFELDKMIQQYEENKKRLDELNNTSKGN